MGGTSCPSHWLARKKLKIAREAKAAERSLNTRTTSSTKGDEGRRTRCGYDDLLVLGRGRANGGRSESRRSSTAAAYRVAGEGALGRG